MPDFFDMVQCPDCGAWYPAGEGLSHRQSHDRTQRGPYPGKIINMDIPDVDNRVLNGRESKRGSNLDTEV